MGLKSENYTLAEEIRDTRVQRPHIVILGAGASRQAFPDGDADGQRLPLMTDLAEVLGLESDLMSAKLDTPLDDFEALYTEVVGRADLKDLRTLIERRVDAYFSALEMPECSTLYDHLVCSLRPKDRIATFNWDPFLYDAMVRNQPLGALPRVRFLHGCVRLGSCRCGALGRRNEPCHRCGHMRKPLPLLYPVARKEYAAQAVISSFWESLREDLRGAYILTVFGYGAPRTDAEAISLMSEAWGAPAFRSSEQIELIDVKGREDLTSAWRGFIHTHHYHVHRRFLDSLVACHPRRSCEVMFAQLVDVRWVHHQAEPRFGIPLAELHASLHERLEAEL